MRRAIRMTALALILAGLAGLAARTGASDIQAIDGTGLVDYTRKPDFKVGDWVKYHVTGHSEEGKSDDYMVTVLIAGEERHWGDDGFWVETWFEPKGRLPRAFATLVSYSIFDDPAPLPHMKLYFRKFISGRDRYGMLRQRSFVPSADWITSRDSSGFADYQKDTLGMDSVRVAPGSFLCHQVKWHFPGISLVDRGDSTVRAGVDQTRMRFLSHKVPITSLVREDMTNISLRSAWKIGHSEEAREVILDRATGTAELVGFGSGLVSKVLPEAVRRPLHPSSKGKGWSADKPTTTRKPGG